MEAGKFEQAERQFAQALQINPKLIEAQNLMGVALDQEGRHKEARVYFRKALALRNNYAPAHANLGLNAIQLNDFQFAASEFRRALNLDPHPPNADALRYNLSLALYHIGEYEQSLQVLKEIGEPARDAGYFALAGSNDRELGNNSEAVRNLEKALAIDPGNTAFLYDLSITLIQEGSAPEAIRRLNSGIQGNPNCAELYAALGVAYYATGKDEEAGDNYRTAVRLEPDAADLRSALGDLYFAAASYDKSTAEYEAASKLDPRNVSYLLKQGRNWLKLQQSPTAEAVFQRTLAIDRNNAEAQLNLGRIASQHGDVNAALGHLERAVTLRPDNSAALYQLGLLYKKTGQPEKAASAMKRFRELNTSAQ